MQIMHSIRITMQQADIKRRFVESLIEIKTYSYSVGLVAYQANYAQKFSVLGYDGHTQITILK
ncbi:hypothetical protein EAW55_13795 [Legionella jordanis]|uniref:Uncharacterized protein n=1 Tax=Legionella jordanis TaxID=456 RepID=A0A0W0VAY2_9GAMM|nr:hypothetical protein Ljor_1589 [Legionella jordanis]RMW99472.1 hypothetical protein EAW55_13795 [Legionella jordanis]RMX15322.1 hypothetical protein EAS68_12640 [Legionella jordanis]VEH12518.1 Uncharacterised protein [Legionella jordanis]